MSNEIVVEQPVIRPDPRFGEASEVAVEDGRSVARNALFNRPGGR
jgi:hypothetical protein